MNTINTQIDFLLRKPQVLEACGASWSTVHRRIRMGTWTPPIKEGAVVVWPASEVAALNAARIAGKGEEEIRSLVAELVRRRKEVA